MVLIIRHIEYLVLFFLLLLTISAFGAESENIENSESDDMEYDLSQIYETLHRDIVDNNISGFSSGLVDLAKNNQKLYQFAKSSRKPFTDVLQMIDISTKVYLGSPIVLDELVEKAKSESDLFRNKTIEVPEFGNPLESIDKEDLKSTDPKRRASIFKMIEERETELLEKYNKKYQRLSGEREIMFAKAKVAEDDWRRSKEASDILLEINNSSGGALFNALNAKFRYLVLDSEIFALRALSVREAEAKALVRRYDKALNKMDHVRESYDDLISATRYFRAKELVISKATIVASDDLANSNPFKEANQDSEELKTLLDKSEEVRPRYSIHTKQLDQIAYMMAKATKKTKEEAQVVLERASKSHGSFLSQINSLVGMVKKMNDVASYSPSATANGELSKTVNNYSMTKNEVNITINLIEMQNAFGVTNEKR
ncbi:MAG: hypothetical protein JAZ17_04485 [Candidatus Thiodiazotropha endolucinida]|nr:hypothetical protein [Candidatus Thiodiazotropha endolucinida]